MKAQVLSLALGVPLLSSFAACAARTVSRPTAPAPQASIATVAGGFASWEVPKRAPEPTDAGEAPPPAPAPMPDPVVSDAGTKLGGGQLLTSPCVKPEVHAAVAFATREGGSGEPMLDFAVEDEHVKLDLDRDGKNDVVLNGGAERWTTTFWLYVRRGGCGYFVGEIASADALRPLPTQSRGLVDLRAVNDDCPKHSGLGVGWCEIVYRFDGARYVPLSEKPTARPRAAMP